MKSSRIKARRNTFVDITDRVNSGGSSLLGGTRKKSDMMVLLEREDGRYTAGETVRGRVHIILTQDISIKDLVVRFYGCGRVSWSESQTTYIKGSAPTVSCKNTETYLDHSLSLINKDNSACIRAAAAAPVTSSSRSLSVSTGGGPDEGFLFAAGNHGFQFDFALPSDLPGSFEGRWGDVRYTVKATLKRPCRFDIEREAELNVSAHLDLNDDPELAVSTQYIKLPTQRTQEKLETAARQLSCAGNSSSHLRRRRDSNSTAESHLRRRPIGGLGEFNPGLMCFRSGPISVELRVGRRGYVPGDSIQVSADVENTSAYKLCHCRIALMQHVTFRSGRKVRKSTSSVTSVDKENVLPRTTARWHNEVINVPDILPASSPSSKPQRNIDIRYALTVQLRYSRWSESFSLPVTLVVGTVPLRRPRVNSYLAAMFSQSSSTHSHTTDTDAAADVSLLNVNRSIYDRSPRPQHRQQ